MASSHSVLGLHYSNVQCGQSGAAGTTEQAPKASRAYTIKPALQSETLCPEYVFLPSEGFFFSPANVFQSLLLSCLFPCVLILCSFYKSVCREGRFPRRAIINEVTAEESMLSTQEEK